jgi:imidazolonepropionase-like amidohydrolase
VGAENIGLMHSAGVPIVAGTDAGGGVAAHGASMLSELAELVNYAGLTPAQALTAATATPAREFGLRGRGRIAPGMRADLLMVNGDPTADINAMFNIAQIWKNGYPVDRTPS